MTTLTRSDVLKLLLFLAAAFDRKELPDETARVYLDRLVGLNVGYEAAQRHTRRLVDNEDFFPSIARLRQYLLGQDEQSWHQAQTQLPELAPDAPPPLEERKRIAHAGMARIREVLGEKVNRIGSMPEED